MTTRRLLPLLAAVTLVAGGCAEAFDATTLGVPVTMASPAGEAPQGDSFSVSSRSVHALWGLVPLSRSSIRRALGVQAIDAPIITGVKITVRSRWSDLLVSALTLGILVPRTVTYEGVVVRNQ